MIRSSREGTRSYTYAIPLQKWSDSSIAYISYISELYDLQPFLHDQTLETGCSIDIS